MLGRNTATALTLLALASGPAAAYSPPQEAPIELTGASFSFDSEAGEEPIEEIAEEVELRLRLTGEKSTTGMIVSLRTHSRQRRVGRHVGDALLAPEEVGEPVLERAGHLGAGVESRVHPRLSVRLEAGVTTNRSMHGVGPAAMVGFSWDF